MTISPNASTVWRNYETDGVPASGNHKIKKSATRTWGTAVETAIDAYSSGAGSIAKATRALLYADLAHVADVMAWVYADSTVAYNGIYRKSGTSGSGSWTRILDLPYEVIVATDAGAGTANAIVATSSIPVSESALILLNVFEANTGSPVTVAFNGGSALTIKTASGNNVASGGLVAGAAVLGRISGSTFRMVSDQASAAIQAAAEAALVEFETHYLGSYTTAGQPTLDNEGNALVVGALYWNSTESEMRVWDGGTWQSFGGGLADGSVTDAKLATASAVQNRTDGYADVRDPGYAAGAAETGATNQTAVQAAMDAAATAGVAVVFTESLDVDDELKTSSNLHIRGNAASFLRQQTHSTTGGFLTNLRNSSADIASIQSNILLEHVNITGEDLPDPVELEVSSASGTSVVFTSGASAVDDFYLGLAVADTTAVNTGLRIIIDYVGSTRTATLSSAWSSDPTAGTKILVGYNENGAGFAAGVTDLLSIGGTSKGYPSSKQVPPGLGGKGFNFEQGVTNSKIIGRHAEDCGTAFFVQGVDGSFTNGAAKRAVALELMALSAKNCGSLLTVAGINTSADPDGDANDSMLIADGIVGENVGHSPHRLVTSDQQKSGIINFLEAQNATIRNVRTRNDSGYPASYPTDYTTRCGYGLTGNIGAMIWGWGRNLHVDGFEHTGNVGNVIVVRRGRALGDDAGGTGAPQNCFNWDFRGIKHNGVIDEYIIRIDPTLAYRVDAAELTGQIEVSVNGSFVTGGLVDPNMASFSAITLTLRDHVGGKVVVGTPAQIYAAGNTFASFTARFTDLRTKSLRNAAIEGEKYTLADGTATSVTPPKAFGIVAITSSTSLLRALVDFRTTGGAQCACIGTEPSNFTALNTDGTLTGLTGALNDFTVRAYSTDGKLYFENQRGVSIEFYLTFLG